MSQQSEGTHCDEYETSLGKGNALRKIFISTDFRSIVTVDKLRTTFPYKGFEIAVDIVKELGTFCEIEARKYRSITKARFEIQQLAETLGFTEWDRVRF